MPSLKKKLKKAAGFTLHNLFSGEEVVNNLGFLVNPNNPDLGTDISKSLGSVPYAGGALQTGFDIGAAPATWITAGLGPTLSTSLKGAGPLGRIASGFVSPVLENGSLVNRAAAEVGVGVAGKVGGDIAESIAPEPLKPYAEVAGTLLGGGMAVRSIAKRTAAVNAPTVGIGGQAVDRLTALLEKAKPIRGAQDTAQNAVRGFRSGQARAAYEAGGFTPQSFYASRRRLAGALPQAQFTFPNNENVDPADISALMERIHTFYPKQLYLTSQNTTNSFLNLVLNKKLPTKSELRELERVFGTRFTNAILKQRSPGEIFHENIIDLINLPRAIMSAVDLSAPLNQGAMAVTRKEWWTSWKPMLKAFVSEQGAQDAAKSILYGKYYKDGTRAKLYEASLGRVGNREEAFASRFAKLIPGVARSERAYVTFLNKLRWDMWENTLSKYERAGVQLTTEDKRKLANVFNVMTGRGNMPGREVANVLDALLFSPRRLTSVIERAAYAPVATLGGGAELLAGRKLLPGSAIARREAARDVVGFISTGIGVLSLMNIAGIADVELNPLSADFGKGRIGKMRYDPWGGFQQVARYTAQAMMGARKDSLGNTSPVSREAVLSRFVESKLGPVQGAIADIFSGRTMTGDTVDLQNPDDVKQQLANRLVPLFLQNLDEAAQEEGLKGVFKALPGGVGVGVQTYDTIADVRERTLAEEAQSDPSLAGKTWEQLTPGQQQNIEEKHPDEFNKVRIQSDYEDARLATEEWARGEQRKLAEAFNRPDNPITPEMFRKGIETLQQDRRTKLEQARADFGIKEKNDPNDIVGQWYGLRKQATEAYGIVDPQALDQIQEDFYNTLNAEDKKKVDDLREYRPDPSVQWYFDAKKTIADAGYWDVQKQALAKFQGRLPKDVKTLYDLMESIQEETNKGNRREAARLQALLNAVNNYARDKRIRLRRQNPALDAALVKLYAVKPMHR